MRFRNRQHAEQAKEAMEGCVLGKRPIRVGWGEASTQRNCVHVQFDVCHTGLEPRTRSLCARPQGTHTPQRSSASSEVGYSHV